MKRFWSKVCVRGPNECWEWDAALSKNGYGAFSVGSKMDGNKRTVGAHVMALQLTIERTLESGEMSLHTCDNKPCCNPAHLYIGDYSDNRRDSDIRGRSLKGAKHPNAMLTDKQVKEIRKSTNQTLKELSVIYGVHHMTIWRIRNYKRYRPL